jgi:hypothetical protein
MSGLWGSRGNQRSFKRTPLSFLWDSTIREEAVSRRTEKLKVEVMARYKWVRALHVCYYTSEVPIEDFSQEFFFAIGSILESGDLDFSKLRFITRERVEQFLKDDR